MKTKGYFANKIFIYTDYYPKILFEIIFYLIIFRKRQMIMKEVIVLITKNEFLMNKIGKMFEMQLLNIYDFKAIESNEL